MEFEDDSRFGADVEPDSDLEDSESDSQLSQWLSELENYAKGKEPPLARTVVTPKMAMDSFRYSFMSEGTEVNFDAILGELCELESQLVGAASPTHRRGGGAQYGQSHSHLDPRSMDIPTHLNNGHANPHLRRPNTELECFRTHYPGDLGGYSDAMLDIQDTDSAFSESASLPSSESFTSMVTVSSSTEGAGQGDTASTGSGSTLTPNTFHCELFVRAFAHDGSSKSIMVDEKMTVLEVVMALADKNHVTLDTNMAVIEHMPELFMERILEDHDSLVENMVMWTRDTKNKVLFEPRPQKYDLFKSPERYLLVSSASERGACLDPRRRENLIQEFFSGAGGRVPEVEGVLYLKADGKKAWKKYFFVLRASGLYYNPKGKVSKCARELVCLVQLDYVDLYTGLHWRKKYHAPTDFTFALKHPQIQKKTSKYIRYFCAENRAALDQWIMGIRIAKYGKQLLTNYQKLQQEIACWDTHESHGNLTSQDQPVVLLNEQGDLHDSRLSMPVSPARHSIVNVKNSSVTESGHSHKGVSLQSDKVDHKHLERKSSLTGAQISEPLRLEKGPVKRVSFSTTHRVIDDHGAELHPIRHRDSITSASTDSSEDSNSSGEGRMAAQRASKLRPKLPVTTGTTKQISEMVQTSMDGSSIGSMDSSLDDWKPGVTSPVLKEMSERRRSAPVCLSNEGYSERKSDYQTRDHMSYARTLSHEAQSPTCSYTSDIYTGHTNVMSPPVVQKGVKSHSRGSSLSSVDSSDSYQGFMSPLSTDNGPHESQNWDQSQYGLKHQTSVQPKPGPPVAQKPASIRKGRPQSGPALGPLEKGHKRNSSRSSLESVEESFEGHRGPIPVSSPVPPRASHTRSLSQPSNTVASHFPGGIEMSGSASQPNTPSVSMSSPHHHYPLPGFDNHSVPNRNNSSPARLADEGQNCFPFPEHATKGPVSTPASNFQPPHPSSPLPSIGCMSPRLSSHRVSGPKHVAPPVVPCTPPAVPCTPPTPPVLVPPTPRNPSTSAKTHKKRPSGGNIVVNGSDASSAQHDIAFSPKSNNNMCIDKHITDMHVQSDEKDYASLPFMAELNQHMTRSHDHPYVNEKSKVPPNVLPKPHDPKLNGNYSGLTMNHSQEVYGQCMSPPPPNLNSSNQHTVSSNQNAGKKIGPPPPPRRSETTKLSSSCSSMKSSQDSAAVFVDDVPNDIDSDPVYENYEGLLDVNELPPPPPELLADSGDENTQGEAVETPRVGRPPPPPPPRRTNIT
ncbi:uncharacterized protein LOC128229271 isoform X2 [Mya arenaria]|uniref:uncharacterized protein LOC128229271 isoform X2 n=1 Tax=Mya arenaria TaxID=6604 RepID=UPI0022E96298|nr:uncharacterized protein LOC128229271 isoform X2 [Mya arenaria]